MPLYERSPCNLRGGVSILIYLRINCCQPFAEARCSHQTIMERVYLVPQFIDPQYLTECQTICLSCEKYVEVIRHVIDPKDDRRSRRDRRSGIERRLAFDPRFLNDHEWPSAPNRKRGRGRRIINFRSGEDRRSGQDRRQSKSSIKEQETNTL